MNAPKKRKQPLLQDGKTCHWQDVTRLIRAGLKKSYPSSYWVVKDRSSQQFVIMRTHPLLEDASWIEELHGPFKGGEEEALSEMRRLRMRSA